MNNTLLASKEVSAVLNEGKVIEAVIGRGNLRVRIIDMGLGLQGLRLGHPGWRSGLYLPKAKGFADLSYDVLILDEGKHAHRAIWHLEQVRGSTS